MTFRRRSYPEVLNHLLTGILGGVTAESHPYPPTESGEGPHAHALQKTPVQQILAVYGERNGQSHEFVRDTDYALAGEGQTLQWLEGGQTPDPGTVLDVDYMPAGVEAAVTDIQIGSVVRTLAESIGLEMARMYAQMEGVYKSAFIDTAAGKALDNVVALLDLTRITAGRFTAEIAFTRTPGSHGEIHIPAGTRILTEDGQLEYETTAATTLLEGQNSAKAVGRDVEDNSEGAEAGTLTVLAKPIAGISEVTNEIPASQSNADETDSELRTRAKSFLHGSEKATVGAIQEAVTRQGIKAEVVEKMDGGVLTGAVEVIPHAESIDEDLRQRINTAIYDVRPAGIQVTLADKVAPTRIDLTIRVTTSPDLLETDLRAAQERVREEVADYFNALPASESGSVNRIIGLVMGVPEIEDVEILEASVAIVDNRFDLVDQTTLLGTLDIIDPNLPTQLQLVVGVPDGTTLPAAADLSEALSTAVNQINAMNESVSLADEGQRALSFERLLYVLPLPHDTEGDTGSFNDLLTESPPALPAASHAEPYNVSWSFSRQSGVSQIVEPGAAAFVLEPFERLQLAGVTIEVEADDA